MSRTLKRRRRWWCKHKGYEYDHVKRMWFKVRSRCCQATVTQRPVEIKRIKKRGKKSFFHQFRYFCDSCGKQTELDWKFKHE